MPKIINVDENSILEITRELIKNKRYEDLNCRTIAKIAGIGVGTLYNYFDSKMSILASVMLEDWNKCFADINYDVSIKEGLSKIYHAVKKFSYIYYDLWENEKKDSFEYINIMSKHNKVINQINYSLKMVLDYNSIKINEIELNFISNNISRYASSLYDYEKLENIFIKIIGGDLS